MSLFLTDNEVQEINIFKVLFYNCKSLKHINYEKACKVYMHACLTPDFPNVAVHSFSFLSSLLVLSGFWFCFLNLLYTSFILACTERDFTLQMKMQTFPSH